MKVAGKNIIQIGEYIYIYVDKILKKHFVYIILLRSSQVSREMSWFQVGIGG